MVAARQRGASDTARLRPAWHMEPEIQSGLGPVARPRSVPGRRAAPRAGLLSNQNAGLRGAARSARHDHEARMDAVGRFAHRGSRAVRGLRGADPALHRRNTEPGALLGSLLYGLGSENGLSGALRSRRIVNRAPRRSMAPGSERADVGTGRCPTTVTRGPKRRARQAASVSEALERAVVASGLKMRRRGLYGSVAASRKRPSREIPIGWDRVRHPIPAVAERCAVPWQRAGARQGS